MGAMGHSHVHGVTAVIALPLVHIENCATARHVLRDELVTDALISMVIDHALELQVLLAWVTEGYLTNPWPSLS
jgi:hypothetical protein